MEELESVLILCILLELFSECRLSEKYDQYFSFLTGLMITTSIAGIFLSGMGVDAGQFKQRLERELKQWETEEQFLEDEGFWKVGKTWLEETVELAQRAGEEESADGTIQ